MKKFDVEFKKEKREHPSLPASLIRTIVLDHLKLRGKRK